MNCIHCGMPSSGIMRSGLCAFCFYDKLQKVERMIMDAPCQFVKSNDTCNCVACCTKYVLVLLTNKYANPKEKQ